MDIIPQFRTQQTHKFIPSWGKKPTTFLDFLLLFTLSTQQIATNTLALIFSVLDAGADNFFFFFFFPSFIEVIYF